MTRPMPTPRAARAPQWIDEAEFARRLIARAVTQHRVEQALAGLTANALPISTISAGLGGLVRVSAEGRLGTPRVRPQPGGSFAVTVPATVDLAVKLGGDSHLGADVEIDLALTPRPADPLLLVIDLAPVRPGDVRITARAGGLGATVAPFLGVVLDELGKQIARSVTTLLDSPKVRAGRTIDIAARIDSRPDAPPPPGWQWIDDATFGRRFLRAAVTEQRLTDAFAKLAGTPLSIGPLTAGPRDMATVTAQGAVGTPAVTSQVDEGSLRPERVTVELAFDADIPIALDLVVAVGRENRYHADITVELRPVARPADPLLIVLDIPPVVRADVSVHVVGDGRLAKLVGRAGHLEDQLLDQVVKNVNDRLADASSRAVDVGARVDGA